eukprot:COSAG04_NODE_4389_length_2124_cov_5.966914_3_plen_143_part_00
MPDSKWTRRSRLEMLEWLRLTQISPSAVASTVRCPRIRWQKMPRQEHARTPSAIRQIAAQFCRLHPEPIAGQDGLALAATEARRTASGKAARVQMAEPVRVSAETSFCANAPTDGQEKSALMLFLSVIGMPTHARMKVCARV